LTTPQIRIDPRSLTTTAADTTHQPPPHLIPISKIPNFSSSSRLAHLLLKTASCNEIQKVTLLKKQNREELAREILAYFLRNPQCVDDLMGIANWRLLDQMIHRAVHDTSDAVEWLVTRGYLDASAPTGADRIFRLNEDKRDEALLFVEENEPEDRSDSQ
jgi:hypothetical protein